MKKSAVLIQERAALIEAQKRMHTLSEKENRDYTEAETIEFRRLQGEIEALNAKVQDALAYEENLRMMAGAGAGAPVGDGEGKEKNGIAKRFSINRALRAVNPANIEKLDGAEKEAHEIGVEETRNAGVNSGIEAGTFSLPLDFLRAAQQTITQDSGSYGSALMQNQAPRIVDPLRPLLFLEKLGATFLPGLSGGNLPLVVAADYTMEWLAEGATGTAQKKTYAGPTLSPKRAFGAVSLTNQWLMQTSVGAENMVMNGIRQGFANLLQVAAINGAGAPAPMGVLNTSGINVSTQVAAAAATWAKIVELQALIEEDDATENSLGYLIHPKVKAALKQITKDAGSGRFLLEGDSIDGYKFVSTSLVPTLVDGSTNVYPVIYGDWSKLNVGQWGAVNIKVNPYSEDLADSVRLTLNTHADVAIATPKAFAKNAFISA